MIRDEDVSLREDGSFSVRSSLAKIVLMALGSAAFVAASGWICVYWLSTIPAELATSSLTFVILTRLLTVPIFIASLVGVLFFGYCLLFFMFRLVLFWRPVIEIGPRGIVDRASAVSAGFVPWDSVKDVAPVKSSGQDFIGIMVKDERALLQRQNSVKRLAMRINSRLTDGASINVPLVGLPVTGEDLLVEIRPHLDPPAQKRLDKHLSDARSAGPTSTHSKTDGAAKSPFRTALRIIFVVLQWLWAFTLTIFFVASAGILGVFGGIVGWSGLRALFDLGNGAGEWWHAPVGLAMIVFGLLMAFVLMDPVVRKLSGRDPIEIPYH